MPNHPPSQRLESPLLHDCIQSWFEAQVRRTPEAVAVMDHGECLSYGWLNQRVNALAHYLRRLQVGSEVLVGLCLDRSLDQIVGMLAIVKAGGAYVPLDPSYPRERLALMLSDAKVSVLLTQSHYLADLHLSELLGEAGRVVCLDRDGQAIAQESSENPDWRSHPQDLAYVIYTSGSTGKPKGVMIEHQALLSFLQSAQPRYGIQAGDRVLQFSSISFDAAVEEIFVTLTQGATLVLRTPEMLFSVSAFFQASQDLGITIWDLPTAFWHKICAELSHLTLPSCLRLVIIGGERVVPHWLAAWHQFAAPIRMINTYGPTETTVVVTCCDLGGPQAVNSGGRLVPIGQPLAHVSTYVLDANHQPVPVGQQGELYIGGASLARGYLHRPETTAQQFLHLPLESGERVRVYKTGDLVRDRGDGQLEFLGRVDYQEKIRGFRVELREIEITLEQHLAVKEAIVLAREDTLGDKRLVAYVLSPWSENLALGSARSRWESEQLEQWRLIHNDEHLNPTQNHWDKTFNISGWISSYTQALIPDLEMQEWVQQTVSRILDLNPCKVLEIGCGTGLLLFQIAPHCLSYVGTDFSETTLNYIQQQLQEGSISLPQVSLEQREANNFQGYQPHTFDTIIINSVLQYFPSLDYLIQVLEQAVQLVQPEGYIFLGDIRNYQLLDIFATAVELSQAPDDLNTEELIQRIQYRTSHEEELTLDPDFFRVLPQHLPQITQVQVLVKRGQFHNEMTQFRYDVVLQVGGTSQSVENYPCLDWTTEFCTPNQLQQYLSTHQPACLEITSIPNSRTAPWVKAWTDLQSPHRPAQVVEFRQQLANSTLDSSIDPEDIWQLAEELGYQVTLSVLNTVHQDTYTTLFQHKFSTSFRDLKERSQPELIPPKPLSTYANHPLKLKAINHLSLELRTYLKQQLPSYMIPSSFVILEEFPLTPNGKVDRRALPKPDPARTISRGSFVAPRTPLEQEISDIWSRVLNIQNISIYDNFFDLGGDSLRLIQLLSQVELIYPKILSFNHFFSQPTILGLVEQIQKTQQPILTLPDNWEHSYHLEPMTLEQLKFEASLEKSLPGNSPNLPIVQPLRSILLTGATGFVGVFVLWELLQQTDADIYCLIRAQTSYQAYQKLQATFEQYLPTASLPRNRIYPVLGDLSYPQFNLSEAAFASLTSQIDQIYHLGANVNLLYPYQALKAVNVLGTKTVLDLATTHKLKPIHYISTLDVFESLAMTDVLWINESDSIAQGRGIVGGYAQSKWVAEQLVSTAVQQGVPATIYRLGMITGHSHTGRINPQDLFGRLLQSMMQLQCAPDLDFSIDLTPVDYVSQAIAHISQQPSTLGHAFHLLNPQPIPLTQLVNYLNRLGYPVHLVAYEEWLERIKRDRTHALSPLVLALTNPLENSSLSRLELWLSGTQRFSCRNTQQQLQGTSITCPPITLALLEKIVTALTQPREETVL